MKRLILTLLILLMLVGCTAQPLETTDPTVPSTEPAAPWVEELGMNWDAEGILKEMPLTIPDGLHYSAAMEFDGDLLLWSLDTHRKEHKVLELVVVELDDGTVTAQGEVEAVGYVTPECLGNTLYVCDGAGGVITALNKNLAEVGRWETEPTEEPIYVGADGIIYCDTMTGSFVRDDLNAGQWAPLLEGDPAVDWASQNGETLTIRYYRPDNGQPAWCILDLVTGEYEVAQVDSRIDSVSRMGNTWLHEIYGESYIYYLYGDDGSEHRINPKDGTLRLLDGDYMLGTSMDCKVVSLYAMDGSLISCAQLSEEEIGYFGGSLIWNEANGGYFFVFHSFDDTSRLLFWDTSKSMGGEDLILEPVPEPDEAQVWLEARATELGEQYGLIILVGEQCDTEFDSFTATLATDYDQVNGALNVLERALEMYPASMIRQLRYGEVKNIQIHLIQDLMADGEGRTGDGYNAFAQTLWDRSIIVMDIADSSEQTYYHEFSHLIDRYLEWHAESHPDALYSESAWESMNPSWFDGYTYDYAWERELWDGESFIDGYSTVKPTEDRARVMEHAMVDTSNYNFTKGTILYEKLDWYCRCIRDAFDTTSWPDELLWERFL